MLLISIFQPEHHFSKCNSAHLHPSLTISIQLLCPTPFSMSIAIYLVNVVWLVLIVCLQLSLCSSSGYYTIAHPSSSFGMNTSSYTCAGCALYKYPFHPFQMYSNLLFGMIFNTCPMLLPLANPIWAHVRHLSQLPSMREIMVRKLTCQMSGDPHATSTPQVPNHTSR